MPKVKTWLGELSKKHANFVFQRRYGTKSYFYLKPDYPYKASSAQQTIRNRYKLAKNHYKNLSERSKYLYAEKLDSEALSAWNQLVRRVEKTFLGGEVLVMFFDELTGNTVYDVSEYENNGTIYGATWRNEGFGLYFDGKDDYIEAPQANIANAVSACAWIKHYESSTFYDAFVMQESSQAYYSWTLRFDNNLHPQFAVANTDPHWYAATDSKIAPTDTWIFLCGTYNDDTKKIELYRNKDLVGTGKLSGTWAARDGNVFIGRYPWENVYVNGFAALIRTYRRILSRREIEKYFELERVIFGV